MEIFGNKIAKKTVEKAISNQKKLARKFKHKSDVTYEVSATNNSSLFDSFGLKDVEIGNSGEKIDPENGILIGTIRMGYGHYRIAMAMASAAKSKGLTPYWFDLLSFEKTTAGKIIDHLNSLYSLGSKISQKVEIFNRYYWEPLNSEGFKKLSYNVSDLKMTELMTNIYSDISKDIPYIATHAWPAQSGVAAGMNNVINVIPDNWPMGLHLAEGSLHVVQSESSYLGYRILREMGDKGEALNPMPEADLRMAGHYVDHELVVNLEADCERRLKRIKDKKERRLLFSVGGAGAQLDTLIYIIKKLESEIESGKVTILINAGDHEAVWNGYRRSAAKYLDKTETHFDNMESTKQFADAALNSELKGIHFFKNQNIFAAVYTTNLLMRCSDILVTKPSELAFYPIPKLFIKRVGGHEMWGAIRGAEIGESTIECNTDALLNPTLDILINEDNTLKRYCENILKLKQMGVYNGAYNVIDMALERKKIK